MRVLAIRFQAYGTLIIGADGWTATLRLFGFKQLWIPSPYSVQERFSTAMPYTCLSFILERKESIAQRHPEPGLPLLLLFCCLASRHISPCTCRSNV